MTVASATGPHSLVSYRDEFPIFNDVIYLNSCSLGALSRRSRAKIDEFLNLWDRRGASAWYDVWWQALADVRAGYAAVIGAQSTEIALHASVSTALSVVASSLDLVARPKVVTTALDFPTLVYQWLVKRKDGVEVEIVPSPDGLTVPVDALAAAIDERTALVATSHVYFTTGAIQDIRAVADAAHEKGALCFIDAYQGVGQIPVDVSATGVDFLSSGGLKWLLGGPGLVFLYAREDLVTTLEPTVTGWFAHERQFDFDPTDLQWFGDARRLEQGTPALAAVYAQLGGLEIIREVGVPKIREVVADLTDDLIDRASGAGLKPKVARRKEDRSAIVMIPDEQPYDRVRQLAAANVIADARPGHVRLSPFFYNVKEDNAAAIQVLIT